jgi:hypothetical protein
MEPLERFELYPSRRSRPAYQGQSTLEGLLITPLQQYESCVFWSLCMCVEEIYTGRQRHFNAGMRCRDVTYAGRLRTAAAAAVAVAAGRRCRLTPSRRARPNECVLAPCRGRIAKQTPLSKTLHSAIGSSTDSERYRRTDSR